MDLDHSELSFQMLVGVVRDYAIYMLDPNGRIVTWNAGSERIKGYTAEEAIGQNISILYTKEDREAGRPTRALRIAAEAGRYEEEGWRVRKDGTRFLAHVIIDPVRNESGRLVGFAEVTRDITAKRDLERQLAQAQKMEAVGQLTGGIAHDFNNMLSVIVGNLELLLEDLEENSVQNELVVDALSAGERGAELVRQLLAFSRNQTLQPEIIDVHKVSGRIEPLLRTAVGEGIELNFICEDEPWPVLADPSQLESAILNLAVNARDAMPDGGRLTIRCKNVGRDEDLAREEDLPVGDYVVFTIADTGAGIDPDILSRVFEPFFTTKGEGRGTGLGLSMVYGFARQSGGTVKIYSELDRGTEVRLYLPPAMRESEADAAPVAATIPARSGERILVVEDREEVRRSAVRVITALGYEATEADSADAALDLIDGGLRFDLLFTDIVMPGSMNGIDLARELRRREPGLPIVLTSGFSDPGVIATDLGALKATLLPKPFRRADLSHVLRQALEQ